MTEEEKIFAGKLYCPADPDLRARKLRAHNLCTRYNAAFEDDAAQRSEILRALFASLGADSFLQGPIYIHYGCHTTIGERFFGNFNLTVQDDAPVVIGDDCCFGPGATIVTPLHPLLPDERRLLKLPDGSEKRVCYAKPVKIGSNCWFGANVTVCPGVTIGDGAIIGTRAVVTKDVPPYTIVGGVPAKPIRKRFDDATIEKLEALRWWDWDSEKIKRCIPAIQSGKIDALERAACCALPDADR